MTAVNDLSNFVEYEGRELGSRTTRLSPTSIRVTWKPPAMPKAYNGVIVVASPMELNPSNFPTNGVRYAANADFQGLGADMIGAATVVGAFYDDLTTASLDITNLDANAAYYISVHLASNVYTYWREGVRAYPEDENLTVAYAGEVPQSYGPPANPTVGMPYYDPDQRMMYVWDGAAWLNSRSHTTVTGEVDPVAPFDGLPPGFPALGNFFYNTRTRMLKSWNGIGWIDVETKKGEPSYARIDVGTTGEPGPRANVKTILKHQLGFPVVCVELTEAHFDIAINNALQEIRRRSDSAYYRQYFFLQTMPNQDVYYLNDATTGVNAVVDVLKIHRMNVLGLTNFGPDNIYAQQFLNQFYSPGVGFDLVAVHLMHALSEVQSQIFAGDIGFNWRESTRELRTYRRSARYEKVLIECSCERPEQELLVDRWTQQWIQQWAEAELMIMLAHIRGKFSTLPGPGGGLSLNADMLLTEGTRLQDDCLRQMKDFEVGQNGGDNGYAPFVIG
jgi:hypothetical protein